MITLIPFLRIILQNDNYDNTILVPHGNFNLKIGNGLDSN